MFRASSAHQQESLTIHTASTFCVCVRPWHCLVRNFLTRKSLARQYQNQQKQLVIDSYFLYIWCATLHVSSVKRSSSGVPHCTYSLQFLCLCPSVALSCKKLSYKKVSYKTVPKPTETTCDRLLFSIYMICNSTCFGLQALIIRSPSLYIQPPVSVFVSVRGTVLQVIFLQKSSYKTVLRTDTNTETVGCMYSEGLLMMSAWRSKHVELHII
jgi:hypothetical protein